MWLRQSNSVSTEMIDPQYGDPIVDNLVEVFSGLRDLAFKHPLTLTSGLVELPEGQKLIKRFNKLCSDRFGINIYLIGNNMVNAFAFITPPFTNTAIFKKSDDLMDVVNDPKYAKTKIKDPSEWKHLTILNDLILNDYYDYFADVVKEMHKMYHKGFYVDLKNARFIGLSPKTYAYCSFDIHHMFLVGMMTPREAIAVMMHELGHLFTHIENSYRGVKNTTVLAESMMRVSAQNEKEYRDGLKLYLKAGDKVDDIDASKIDKASTLALVLLTTKKFAHESLGYGKNVKSSIDSEQLADQFAARFGLASDLQSALHKLQAVFTVPFIYPYLKGFYVLYRVLFTGARFTTLGIILSILTFIQLHYLPGFGSNRIYDNNYRRDSRIRLDLIRQIRTFNLTRDQKEYLVTEIEHMEKMHKFTVPNLVEEIYLAHILLREIFIGELKYERLETLVEDLMENKLHVAATKFELLGGDK